MNTQIHLNTMKERKSIKIRYEYTYICQENKIIETKSSMWKQTIFNKEQQTQETYMNKQKPLHKHKTHFYMESQQ